MAWRYVEARDAAAPLPVRLLSVWRHRRLLQRMAQRDLRQRYVGSTLGLVWAALTPLVTIAIYVFIFTFIFGGRLGTPPQTGGEGVAAAGTPLAGRGGPTAEYAVYVVSGLLPWIAFSEVASRATQTMGEHRSLVKFVVFPVQILPLCSLYVAAFSQGVGLAVVIALATWLQGGLPTGLWLLLPALLLQIVFLAGVAWLLGALGAILRDVKEVVQVALAIGMFLTPIFYLEGDVPLVLRRLIALNPLTHLVRLYREALLGDIVLGGGMHGSWSLPIFAAVAVATLLAGFVVFERTRVFLSDIL